MIIKISSSGPKQSERGSIILYCFVMVAVVVSIGALASFVSQSINVAGRRTNMIQANQFAEGGAVIACVDLNNAVVTNSSATIGSRLTALSGYALNGALSNTQTNVYQRTISAPFSNQTVIAQIWMQNVSSPKGAKIIASATVGPVTQTAKVNATMTWGYPGAIISVNQGTLETANSKAVAMDGNVTINGAATGPIIVDGGGGLAVLANGRVNYDTNYLNPPRSAYSMTNWNTANQIPDYTAQGTSNSLFDLNRFIAIANNTQNGYTGYNKTNQMLNNNHFTNISSFIAAANKYTNTTTKAMEGVVVVDVNIKDKDQGDMTDKNIPKGININGTLLLNFTGAGWDPVTEKIIVTADVNVNPADLSHLVPTNTSTYKSGYPPTYYTDNAHHNPTNINITGVTDPATGLKDFQNIQPGDDMPAMIYSTGVLDMHGNCDISGVLYTPCYVELENKSSSQIQYIKGSVICGFGMYYENLQKSTSIVSYDPNALDSLVTIGSAGKAVVVTYWEP